MLSKSFKSLKLITQSEQQSLLKRIYSLLSKSLLFWYGFMSFFQQPTGDPNLLVTSTIGIIDKITYTILEVISMLLLVIMHFATDADLIFKMTNLILLVFVTIGNVRFWITKELIQFGLIARPIFLSCYTAFGRRIMGKYLKIVKKSMLLFILMWFILLLWSSLAYYLYSEQNIVHSNKYSNPGDSIFTTFVIQTTANYPDISLPYIDKSKTNFLFFALVIIVNTMLISNMITATNYNSYKELAQQEFYDESSLYTLYKALLNTQHLDDQQGFVEGLDNKCKSSIRFINSRYFQLFLWLYSISLFFSICYTTYDLTSLEKQYPALLILNIIILLLNLYEFFVYKHKFWRNHYFEMYEIIATIVGIAAYGYNYRNGPNDTNFQYATLIILRLPKILEFVLSFNFFTSQSTLRFLGKIQQVIFMLFIVCLVFSAVGQIAFGGINTQDKMNTLSDVGLSPYYIYLNFNNTLNSFQVLFALLIINNNDLITLTYTTLMNNSYVRIYFCFYYMLCTQTAYSLVLASLIDHINYKASDILLLENYGISSKELHILKDQEIEDIWMLLTGGIDHFYDGYCQLKPFNTQQYNFDSHERIKHRKNSDNYYSYVNHNSSQLNDIILQIYSKNPPAKTLMQNLNTIINQQVSVVDLQWKQVSVLKLLQKYKIQIDQKDSFLNEIREKIKALNIQKKQHYQFVQLLVQHSVKLIKNKNIVIINYDLPDNYSQVRMELYINTKRIGYMIKLQDGSVLEKVLLKQLVFYFGNKPRRQSKPTADPEINNNQPAQQDSKAVKLEKLSSIKIINDQN